MGSCWEHNLKVNKDESYGPDKDDNPNSKLNNDLLMYNTVDMSYDETNDNILQEGIYTANAGDKFREISLYDWMDKMLFLMVLSQQSGQTSLPK